jgi:hypothetical protein
MNDLGIPFDRVLRRFQPMTTEQQKTLDIFKEFLSHICIKVADKYVFPPAVITVNGTVIATEGNFSASVGKPKSRKTYNVCALTAAMLSGKTILGYKACMPAGKTKLLYVDTEQSRVHCHKVLNRIISMAELSSEEADKRIEFMMLREFTPQERRNIIDMALATDRTIGFVVIDGIRDLINDINSPGESVDIINDLMRWTQMYEIHIHTVLHLNKADDNTRGHIGTELNNKAETVLKVIKNTENPAISEVRPMITRDQEFESFAFRINEQGLPELAAEFGVAVDERISVENITLAQHKSALDATFAVAETLAYGALLSALQREYATIGYKRARTSIVSLAKLLVNVGVIVRHNRLYSYCADNIKLIKG